MAIDKKLIDTLQDANTIVVMQDGGVDAAIAERWLKQNAPSVLADERVLIELHLTHLLPGQAVCAVFRRPDTPAMNYNVRADNGAVVTTPRPDADTFAEIVVTKPVKVGDYWDKPHARAPGKPNTSAFLEALSQTLLPLRLVYADKGEQKPQILKLGTL